MVRPFRARIFFSGHDSQGAALGYYGTHRWCSEIRIRPRLQEAPILLSGPKARPITARGNAPGFPTNQNNPSPVGAAHANPQASRSRFPFTTRHRCKRRPSSRGQFSSVQVINT